MHGYDYILNPHPDAYVVTKENKGKMKRYFLDVFDPLPPRMILRRRIKHYVDYFDEDIWQEATKHPFPKIIIICPDERSKRYLNRFIQKTLEYYSADMEFYVSTWGKIDSEGFSRDALEKVEEQD